MKNKKRKIIITIFFIIIVLLIIAYFFLGGKDDIEYVTDIVEKGEIIQTVSETGAVKANQEIDLNFSQSGKIANIPVKIGDHVEKDQILVELDYASLNIKAKEAQANLDIAQADLSKLLSGATSYEIDVSQASVDQAYKTYLAYMDELEKTKQIVAENIKQAEDNLDDLESSEPENLTAYEQSVKVAETTLENYEATYSQTVDNKKSLALTDAEDKISEANSALNAIDRILEDDDAKGFLSAKNFTYLTKTQSAYDASIELLNPAENSLMQAKTQDTESNTYKAVDDAIILLQEVFGALNYCYSALENSVTTSDFTQAELDTFKSNISAEQATINTGISSLQTVRQNLADAVLAYQTNIDSAEESLTNARATLQDAIIKARNILSSAQVSGSQQISASQAKVDSALESWNVAKAQLAEKESPARSQDVALYRAKVKQAEASLELVQKQIEDSIIKAPIAGTITKINFEVGEQIGTASLSNPVISMLGDNNFEIEIDISEADIYKVRIDDEAEITLDAFGDDVAFYGKVSFIEPAETIIQDVIYYKVTVKFAGDEQQVNHKYYQNIKSGMTANITITTAEKDNVLLAPNRSILEKNGNDKFIRVLENNGMVEKKVEIGLRGDEGLVEIISGVNEGDQVVTQIKDNSK